MLVVSLSSLLLISLSPFIFGFLIMIALMNLYSIEDGGGWRRMLLLQYLYYYYLMMDDHSFQCHCLGWVFYYYRTEERRRYGTRLILFTNDISCSIFFFFLTTNQIIIKSTVSKSTQEEEEEKIECASSSIYQSKHQKTPFISIIELNIIILQYHTNRTDL